MQGFHAACDSKPLHTTHVHAPFGQLIGHTLDYSQLSALQLATRHYQTQREHKLVHESQITTEGGMRAARPKACPAGSVQDIQQAGNNTGQIPMMLQ